MARKKADTGGTPKRYGTLIRVSDEFAESLRRAAFLEGLTMAEFATRHLQPVAERRYKDAIQKEAKRTDGEGK